MKPHKFILNSDYLSIAQTNRNTYNVYIGSGTLQPGGYTEQNFDFAIQSNAGAIDRILIAKDSDPLLVGSYMNLAPTSTIFGFLQVFRTSPTNIRAQLVLENQMGTGAESYPGMVFTIRVASFKPPNVF